ncbi:unnamed protein product [Caenorhabditis sp. 36 PRJEB53466]|nr:unnamed protein product [Caenorhabditis sp. 36 PRJEB53466]
MEVGENVRKKASSEIRFAEYGRSVEDDEEPTQENKRVIDLGNPVDAMSLNNEKTKIVVAGIRGVLQIVKIQYSPTDVIDGPSLIEDLDLRTYRKGKVSILYSAQNVKWNQLFEQYIATTSANGSVVCWNIDRKNKIVYKLHERSATCVDWHADAGYLMMSGSRDSTVRTYDLRCPTTTKNSLIFYDRTCEGIHDMTTCKTAGLADYFLTGDDCGVLRVWDIRNPSKCVHQKVAHRSFISTIAMSPTDKGIVATGGGRDKMVKIWDWSAHSITRVGLVETTAPLGRVVWRPEKSFHIATCASVNETAVHVWDIRRPYLPYVTYDEHGDSVTDACWPISDFDVFLTCGKDGLLMMHNMDTGHTPLSYACDVSFDVTPDGTIGIAVNSEIHEKNESILEAQLQLQRQKGAGGPRRPVPFELFNRPIKSLVAFGIPEALTYSLPPTHFYEIAEQYRIGGMEIVTLCEMNSKIARKAGFEHVAQTWRLVEALCGQANIQEVYDQLSKEEKERVIKAWIVRKKELADEGRRWMANMRDYYVDDVKKRVAERLENTQSVTAFLNFSSESDGSDIEPIRKKKKKDGEEEEKGEGEDDNENEKMNLDEDDMPIPKKRVRKKRKNLAIDYYFGAGEANYKSVEGKKEVLHSNEFTGLRNEAFHQRNEEKEAKFFCKARKQPTNADEYEEYIREYEADFRAWSPMLEIYRLLLYHAEQGDIQTCANISMVCGKRLLDTVDPYTVNGWVYCYMEMLDRLELYLVCAKIRKYCSLDFISSVSRENTTIQLSHADCDAVIVNGRCTKCEGHVQPDCTVCRVSIIGLCYQCHVCGHAMHVDHAFEWFQKTNECAYVGCLCNCGMTTWPDMERTFIPNPGVPRKHRDFSKVRQEDYEPDPNQRIDASRIDSDTDDNGPDEDDDDLPFTTNKLRDKFGVPSTAEWQRPWAKHLARLYTERYKEPCPLDDVETEPPLSPKSIKEWKREQLVQALAHEVKEKDEEIDIALDVPNEGDVAHDGVDKEPYTLACLLSAALEKSESETTEQNTESKITDVFSPTEFSDHLELIEEQNQGGIEDYQDEVNGAYNKEVYQQRKLMNDEEQYNGEKEQFEYQLDVGQEDEQLEDEQEVEEEVEDEDHGLNFEVEQANLEDLDGYYEELIGVEQEMYDDELDEEAFENEEEELYSDDYIQSIGPIGLQPHQLFSDNERVTSPSFGWNRKEFVDRLTKVMFAESSDSSEGHDVGEIKVEEIFATSEKDTEGRDREKTLNIDKPSMSVREKVMAVLCMSKKQKKQMRAKRQKKMDKAVLTGESDVHEDAYDEFCVSTSDENDFESEGASSPAESSSSPTSYSSSELFVPVPAEVEYYEDEECVEDSEDYSGDESSHSDEETYFSDELDIQDDEREVSPPATGDLYEKEPSPLRTKPRKRKKLDAKRRKVQKEESDQSDSDLFSTDEEESSDPSDLDDEPFFPATEDYPLPPRTMHPWETMEQYEERLQRQREEEEAEAKEKEEKEAAKNEKEENRVKEVERRAREQVEAEISRSERMKKKFLVEQSFEDPERPKTPMMRELERLKKEEEPKRKIRKWPTLKRTTFDKTDHEIALNKAIGNLKILDPTFDENEPEIIKNVREKERCVRCKHEIEQDKIEKKHIRHIKKTIDDGQIILAKSLTDPCVAFQFHYMDYGNFLTDVEEANRTAANFVEFIQLLYFVKWEDLLRPDSEFMLKEIYEMWLDYKKKRPRMCDSHYEDFSFRFYAASITTKIMKQMYKYEPLQIQQRAIKYDWLHPKPCVISIDDDPQLIDEMMETPVKMNRSWSGEERTAAKEYWNLFGNVPLHIRTVDRTKALPAADEKLEIGDDTNYWTKKMIRNAAYQSRTHGIKLTYTRVKERDDLFRVQDRSVGVLKERWKARLNQMKNETPRFDFSTSSFQLNTRSKLIHTVDAHNPWPICQIQDQDHLVTIRPLVTRKFVELKSRLRSKFHVRNSFVAPKTLKNTKITMDDIRETRSFKRFEPRLKKNEELQKMMARHFKVVDRTDYHRRYTLYTIIEEEDEVSLIVAMLEVQNLGETEKLDPEEVFAQRKDIREREERQKLAKMKEEKYRKALANTEKFENDKMKIMRNHWQPKFRKTLRTARKVMEIGRLLHEEEVQKWMEFQYELSFAQRTRKRKSLITKKQMLENVPVEWKDAVELINFEEPVRPPYVSPWPELIERPRSPDFLFNSSSSEEDEESEDEEEKSEKEGEDGEKKEKSEEKRKKEEEKRKAKELAKKRKEEEKKEDPREILNCVNLTKVAEKLQYDEEERIALEENDEDWEYSDDSTVSTWFDNDVDDVMNRLVNVNYVDEHMILKERAKGALGQKLLFVWEGRKEEDPLSDDEEDAASLERIALCVKKSEKKRATELLDENYTFRDAGVPEGDRTKELAEAEREMDLDRYDRKEFRRAEVDQLRFFFRQYAFDHTNTIPPYSWDNALHEPIASLHRRELRRVANRAHKKMKDEYEDMCAEEEIIVKAIPTDENSLLYKMINFLLFRESGENFQTASKRVDEANRVLKPLKKYEMFFGKEGLCKLQLLGEELNTSKDLRSSVTYLIRQYGENMEISAERLAKFIKLWWYNSHDSLERFIGCLEETLDTEERIWEDVEFFDSLPQNIEFVRDTIDQLDIASIVNEILYTVEAYVEDMELLYRTAQLPEDRMAGASMSLFDWHRWKSITHRSVEADPRRPRFDKLFDTGVWVMETESDSKEGVVEGSSGSTEKAADSPMEGTPSSDDAQICIELSESRRPSETGIIGSNEDMRTLHKPGKYGSLNEEMMAYYKAVYESVKKAEVLRIRKRTEERAQELMRKWGVTEQQRKWDEQDRERRVHDYMMLNWAVREKAYAEGILEKSDDDDDENWEERIEDYERGYKETVDVAMYARQGTTRYEILEMCGLPVTLDHEMFRVEMDECQSAATSVSDAHEIRDLIEEDVEDEELELPTTDIDEDAQSYCSVKHVLKHELYFQREVVGRYLPSCIILFAPSQFFEDPVDCDCEYRKWRRIIEGSDSPYSFNWLVLRERLLRMCRDEFCPLLLEKYFEPEERNHKMIMEVFYGLTIIIVVDTEMNPWTCRIASRHSVAKPAHDRVSEIRKIMVEDSQKDLFNWLEQYKIDMDVYSRCPVITARSEPLTPEHAAQFSSILMDEEVRDKWLMITKDEGVRALDAIIRMPPTPEDRLPACMAIFRPIYDAWYHTWKAMNDQKMNKTVVKKKRNRLKEYLYKTKLIINYAHQHYRMKKFDIKNKDPSEYQLDRTNIPSASLFDRLDEIVTKFCNEESKHLNDADRTKVKDTLISLATGKIPHFTMNYSTAIDPRKTENGYDAFCEEDDIESTMPTVVTFEDPMPGSSPAVALCDTEKVEEELEWLRSLYEDADMHRRRWMAKLLFELAQKAMFRFAPHLANFEGAQKKFEHLLTLHAKQRPLLDMMLTKVRGTYFMPLETNLFLYDQKLITFSELVDSETHPKDWSKRKESLEENRQQEPSDPQELLDFLHPKSDAESESEPDEDGDADSDASPEFDSDLDSDSDSDEESVSISDSESGSETESNSDFDSESGTESESESESDLVESETRVLLESPNPFESAESLNGPKQAGQDATIEQTDIRIVKRRSKPINPDVIFAAEKRALGPFKWKVRRELNDVLEGIADLDKSTLTDKLPPKKRYLLDYVQNLIINFSDTAHSSWGMLKMKTRIGLIPSPSRLKARHIKRIRKGKKSYKPLRGHMIPGSARLLLCRCWVQNRALCSKSSLPKLAVAFGVGTASLSKIRRLRCETEQHDPWLLVPQRKIIPVRSATMGIISMPFALIAAAYTAIRKAFRCLGLFLRFSPLVLTYPLTRIEAIDDLWWKMLVWAFETSGPTFIKLGQWASTRRDIFSKKFCDRLSVLHIQTKKKRLFRDKTTVLEDVFGEGFMKLHGDRVFIDIEPYSIGSGCIAQVYRGVVDVAEFEKATEKQIPELEGKATQKIAIKVADKGVEQQIELDLSILRTGAWFMQTLVPSLWYLDPTGALEQFEMVLRRQVDLSNEAKALKKFSDNFHSSETGIRFPIVLGYTKTAIVETFEEGIYINRLVAEEGQPELTARQSISVRRRIALMGARALLKMIFVDNFVHGDLHPGNILIRFNDNEKTLKGVHKAPKADGVVKRGFEWFRSLINWRSTPRLRFTDSPDLEDEPTLVLLDTGIAISETPKNLHNLKSLFRSVVEKRGYDVGRLLLTQSPFQQCKDPERFCRQVEKLVLKARSEKSLRTLNISALLSEMFTIVAEHKVELDSAFTTVILSVMVLEGFGRSLDPDLDLFQCARPYLLNVFV